MNARQRLPLVAILTLAAVTPMALGQVDGDARPPAWYLDHLREQMQHAGRTFADNSEYQSATEPFDAYGIEWTWGVGRLSLRGRLFALRDGVEAGDQWEMRTAWHAGEREARAYQFGADGSFGTGWIRPLEGGGVEIEQTFYAPDGSTREVRHESLPLEGGGHVGGSFVRKGDVWIAERSYTWLPEPD